MDDTKYDKLLNKIKQGEKKSIANIIKYSIFSILGALLFIAFSIYQYTEIKSKLDSAKKELNEVNVKLENTREDLEKEKRKFEETMNTARFAYNLQPLDIKRIYSHIINYEEAARIFRKIMYLRNQNVGFLWGGASISTGIDSPNFAVFVLRELGIDVGPLKEMDNVTSWKLLENLQAVEQPSIGDLVIYEMGYVMFYFENQQDEKIVIGMTPWGISALKYKFAPIRGVRRTKSN